MKKITFVNNKGQTMKLDASLTMADLVKMGMTKFRIVPKGTPLRKNEWTDIKK